MFKERSVSVLNESESVESEKNFDDAKLKQIKKDFNELRDRFFKPKIKKIRRNLYEVENKNNLSAQKVKEIENLLELEKNLFELKKYYDYDDIEYKGIRDVQNFFTLSIDEDGYMPIRTSGFNCNYMEYESKGYKDKILSIKEYLNIIRPYLSDIINDHKT